MDRKILPMLLANPHAGSWHMSLWLALIVGCSIGALFGWHVLVGRWIWPKQWATVLNQSIVASRLWILWGVAVLILWAISSMGHS